MQKKLTITIESLVRPHVVKAGLDAAYREWHWTKCGKTRRTNGRKQLSEMYQMKRSKV